MAKKASLIKKGTPHPTRPTFKFESAHLTEAEADKAEYDLLDNRGVVATRQVVIPKQRLVYAKRSRARITPRRPKLKR